MRITPGRAPAGSQTHAASEAFVICDGIYVPCGSS